MRLAEYYQSIMPNFVDFVDLLEAPLPTCVWTNPLKIQPQALKKILSREGYTLSALPWQKGAWQIEGGRIGLNWTYLAGLLQIQEAVSMLPGILLDAKPGEKVLDLCAAPGNKTAQLAVSMQNQGTLVANDIHYGRLRALGQISKRLGLVNLSLTVGPGQYFPKLAHFFDRVLVDAPCSCEGTFRKSRRQEILPNANKSRHLAQIQRALLQRAIFLCKPGGRIVYSTCTFAPEENEAVIHAMLEKFPGQLQVKPIQLPGLIASPGIVEWQGERYSQEVANCLRIWPEQNNTGGFFIAVLEKLPSQITSTVFAKPFSSAASIVPFVKNMQDWFGIPEQILAQYVFLEPNHKGFYFCAKDHINLKDFLSLESSGLFCMKTQTRFPKLSTGAAMFLSQHATKNTVALTKTQQAAYYQLDTFEVECSQLTRCTGIGYLLLTYEGVGIGMGLYFPATEHLTHRIQSLFPKYLKGESK